MMMFSIDPIACQPSSPALIRSTKVMQCGSTNTSRAVSKSMPCFAGCFDFSPRATQIASCNYIVVHTFKGIKTFRFAAASPELPSRLYVMAAAAHFVIEFPSGRLVTCKSTVALPSRMRPILLSPVHRLLGQEVRLAASGPSFDRGGEPDA